MAGYFKVMPGNYAKRIAGAINFLANLPAFFPAILHIFQSYPQVGVQFADLRFVGLYFLGQHWWVVINSPVNQVA